MRNKTEVINRLFVADIYDGQTIDRLTGLLEKIKREKKWGKKSKALVKRLKKRAELLLDMINDMNHAMNTR